MNDKHITYLNEAHRLAKKKFGSTFPNPIVGCLIVKNNYIISKAVTAPEGRPHAEEIALKKAGLKSKGATMYVTLEPCFHKSRNGSCADQILRSGIKKIYIARHDSDKRTNKKSIHKLIKNKISTTVGLTEEKTNLLNNFFFKSLENKRPYIKVKMAISQDQKIAWSNYDSKWISNSKSREHAHKLRFSSQAIFTTAKTISKDNPRFTVRKKNKIIKHLPVIIIDNSLKISLKSNILKDISKKRVIIFTSTKNTKYEFLKSLGCEIILLKKMKNKQLNLKTIFKKIFNLKINNILVESGGLLFSNLIKDRLLDEIHLFTAPFVIGSAGKPLIIGKKIEELKLKEIINKKYGKDIYQFFLTK